MPFIVAAQALLIVAYAILFSKAADIRDNVALCYFAVHVACVGIYPILPGCNAWTINNLAGPAKRGVGVRIIFLLNCHLLNWASAANTNQIAMMICIGNLGGIVGSFIFIEKEKPKYPTGFGSSLSFAAAGMVCALSLEFLYWKTNKKAAEKTEEEWKEIYSEDELEKLGDRSPLFKYQL